MRLIILDDADIVAEWAARFVLQRVTQYRPGPGRRFVLGLPTGGTPLGMYRKLIQFYNERKISFKYVTTFNMDEYVGKYLPTHQLLARGVVSTYLSPKAQIDTNWYI